MKDNLSFNDGSFDFHSLITKLMRDESDFKFLVGIWMNQGFENLGIER